MEAFVRQDEVSDETCNMLTIKFNALLTVEALVDQYSVILGILPKCITTTTFSLCAPSFNEEDICVGSVGLKLKTPRPLIHEELRKLSSFFQKLEWDVSLFDIDTFENVVLSESEHNKVKCKQCLSLYPVGTGYGGYCTFDCRLNKFNPHPVPGFYSEETFVC
jgi:hypothetical protein